MVDNISPIVVDFGQCYTKIGEAKQDVPRDIVPSKYTTFEDQFMMFGADSSKLKHYFGFSATKREGMFTQRDFLDQNRDITDKNVFGMFLHHMVCENFDTSEVSQQGIILLDKPGTSTTTKKEIADQLLDYNRFTKFLIMPDYVGTLYSTGLTTGTVLSCGYSTTYSATVDNGIPNPYSIFYSKFTSKRVESQYSEIVRDLIYQRHLKGESDFHDPTSVDTKRFLEQYGLVSAAASSPSATQKEVQVKLPDGTDMTIPSGDLSNPLEEYFGSKVDSPLINLKARDNCSLQNLITKSVETVSKITKDQFYGNVVVEGGITKLPGFIERLEAETNALSAPFKIKLPNAGDRLLLPWFGASKLKDWIDDNKLWCDQKYYMEHGIENTMANILNSF
jgi:actin-related protein